ncbi:MAG: cytochrome-c peroxidase [Betaproteobacteria bacterium]
MGFRKFAWLVGIAMACSISLSGCGSGADEALSPIARIGEKAFVEPLLSASGRQSCASCHSPETGHAAANALAVQLGGENLDQPGFRNSQSLRYLVKNTAFHFDAEGTPTGGFFWDGRADSLALQAAGPLLSAREMANPDKASVVAKIARTSWANEFKAVFGKNILQDVDRAFDKLTQALAQYQVEDAAFNAYTSKYDAYLRSETALTVQEARGLALFNDPNKGNCASCHTSTKGSDGSHPLFTDLTYDNLGLPRNMDIPANADSNYFDLGLCGRADLRDRLDLCGAFKVPSLRNVALRKTYFHNSAFKSLKDALTFYVQRDTNPEKWYPLNTDGTVNKFNDIPSAQLDNVNTSEAPYNRVVGDVPALSDAEVDDVIVFLRTLTDGWTPR